MERNEQAIQREIFMKPYGYSLFCERTANFNPLHNDENMFGFQVCTTIIPENGSIIVRVIVDTNYVPFEHSFCINYNKYSDWDFDRCKLVDGMMRDFEENVEKHGEDFGFDIEKFEQWYDYIKSFAELMIDSEFLLAVRVREEMKKSELFKF
jgi:hypothetical protein